MKYFYLKRMFTLTTEKMQVFPLSFIKLKPELFFVCFASLFGLIFLILTPPFQVPDEINHFYKAYQVSEGKLLSVKHDDRVGGYIPTSLVKTTEPFLGLRWNKNAKTSFKTISEQFEIPLNPEEKTFVDFPNTSMYSPISYLPQAVSIRFLRSFSLSPLSLFYGARIFTLIFWILSIFLVIRLLPFHKWLFVLISLLPMSLFINMSLSADVASNIISFILIAYLLRMAFSNGPIKRGDKENDLRKRMETA